MNTNSQNKEAGQVEVKTSAGTLYLYTHYYGLYLVEDLQIVLRKEERWDDPSWLTRMIFCQMVPREHLLDENGMGIGLTPTTSVHTRVVLDCVKRFLYIHENYSHLPTWGGTFNRFVDEYKVDREINLMR